MLKKLGLITLSAVSAFAMHSAEININDKDLEVSAKFDLGQFNDTIEPDTTFAGITYLKGSEDNSDDDLDTSGYLEANFLMKREVQDSGITFGIGVKANYTSVDVGGDDLHFITIPLGLEVGYIVPTQMPIHIAAKAYYAPESLSISDADSFMEYRLDATIEMIERGSIVIGYRNLDLDFDNSSSVNYNSSAYFGFRFEF